MKITVSYGNKTYGNSLPSEASDVEISGSQKCRIKINFKASKPGKSWDWASRGSVGGAELELDMNDAKSLAKLILEYSEIAESHSPMEYDFYASARLAKGKSPKTRVYLKPC
jgi:hypothetical protein